MNEKDIAHPWRGLGAGQSLDAPRLVRALGRITVLGGVLTIFSVLVPHPDRRYDAAFFALGGALVMSGTFLLTWWRTRVANNLTLHVVTFVLSGFVLLLAWFSMRDIGGVQAVFLFMLLGISVALAQVWWSVTFLVLQSAGYALVLVTADTPPGFDPFGQWLVVTMGLLTCVAYNGMVRHELAAHVEREQARREERDRERALHAEGLERLNEELQRASETKSSFVAMASHELRTPLTAIEGFALTLKQRWDELEDGQKQNFVDVISDQSQRLGRMVADLLTVSRIESGRLITHPTTLVVKEVVDRTVRELGDLDVAIECDPAVTVRADPDHLQQVLLNFLSNARAYGEPPFVFTASLHGEWVELEVADAGSGIDPEFVPRLFDRFASGHSPRRHDGSSGTGLGLSIVKGLVERNGGSVWFRPNQPTGSRFGVRLPRVRT